VPAVVRGKLRQQRLYLQLHGALIDRKNSRLRAAFSYPRRSYCGIKRHATTSRADHALIRHNLDASDTKLV